MFIILYIIIRYDDIRKPHKVGFFYVLSKKCPLNIK